MTPTAPGKKYYKGRLYQHGRMFPYVVWDGVHAYENIPPPELFKSAELCGPEVAIAQIGKKPHNLRRSMPSSKPPTASCCGHETMQLIGQSSTR